MSKTTDLLDTNHMSRNLETMIMRDIPTSSFAVKISDFNGNNITLNQDQTDRLCEIYQRKHGYWGKSELKENAPELLEVTQELLSIFKAELNEPNGAYDIEKVERIIAKCKGEEYSESNKISAEELMDM